VRQRETITRAHAKKRDKSVLGSATRVREKRRERERERSEGTEPTGAENRGKDTAGEGNGSGAE